MSGLARSPVVLARAVVLERYGEAPQIWEGVDHFLAQNPYPGGADEGAQREPSA